MLDREKVFSVLQDQSCSISVQKKQLNCSFRQLAVELHGNGSEGVIDINRNQATLKIKTPKPFPSWKDV